MILHLKGNEASFAKTCFSSSVGKRSPKTKHLSRFLIAYLAFLDFDSCSVNPQVVGSSPTGGAMKKVTFVYWQRWLFSMISVPVVTGDISSIWYRTSCDDICLRHMKERILYHTVCRISYRVSDIPLKNVTFYDKIPIWVGYQGSHPGQAGLLQQIRCLL